MNKKLAAILSCVILAASLAVSSASARTVYGSYYCPLHETLGGEIVDCHGWRLRSNAKGWDSSCFNLDYLPSQFACSAR